MPQSTDHDRLRTPLARWLAARWPEVRELRLGEFGGAATGYSAQTLIVPLSFLRDGQALEEKVVLRIENPGPPIYPSQSPDLQVEIDIQYRAMRAVGRACNIPLAPLIGYEADNIWLGFEYQDARIPAMLSWSGQAGFNPCLCHVSAGDVTGDGYPDLLLVDYDVGCESPAAGDFNSRLLINQGAANPGFFTDETLSRFLGTVDGQPFPVNVNSLS